jgi:hypothetical protein
MVSLLYAKENVPFFVLKVKPVWGTVPRIALMARKTSHNRQFTNNKNNEPLVLHICDGFASMFTRQIRAARRFFCSNSGSIAKLGVEASKRRIAGVAVRSSRGFGVISHTLF